MTGGTARTLERASAAETGWSQCSLAASLRRVVMKLFYSVRRVVDEAGRSLPNGAAVQGLLFDEAR